MNFAYDGAGRLTSEDYSPCESTQAVYSPPNFAAKTGIEVLYHYDSPPPASDIPPGFPLTAAFLTGRLVAVYDRASLTLTNFDGRGRTPDSAIRVARPGPANDTLSQRYAPRWYRRSMAFDAADREIASTTGAVTTELQGLTDPLTGSTSTVRTSYSRRGTLKSVGGSYNALVTKVDRTADGLINQIQYGDKAQTTTDFLYDIRRRVSSVQTYRGPPSDWTTAPPGYLPPPAFNPDHQPSFQLLLQDDELIYDVVSNPVEIRDWRIADEWPTGAKPVTKKVEYDDLYRARHIDYQYADGDDDWKSPFEAENGGDPDLQDPARADPSPHASFAKRVLWQTYAFDWLGNTSTTTTTPMASTIARSARSRTIRRSRIN